MDKYMSKNEKLSLKLEYQRNPKFVFINSEWINIPISEMDVM